MKPSRGDRLAGPKKSRFHGKLLDQLPTIDFYCKTQALADVAFTLGMLVEAGVTVARGGRTTAKLIQREDLSSAASKLADMAETGHAPGDHLADLKVFPSDFVQLYRTGERSGNIDGALRSATRHQTERADRALNQAAMLYLSILLATLFTVVAWIVAGFFQRYVTTLNRLMKG